MQFFRIKYSCYNTHVVSVKDGDKVIPRLLNHFRPQIPLGKVFEMSSVLSISPSLPESLQVEELTLDELYQYVLDCKSNHLLKVANGVREAWFSFNGGYALRHRTDRKLTPEKIERVKKLLAKKRPKAEIARDVGISRQALYLAIEKLERLEYEEKCLNGLVTKLGREAFEKAPEGSSWSTRYDLREQAKVKALTQLLGFDLALLKQVKVSS